MKKKVVTSLIFLFFIFTFFSISSIADVGPSPKFSISISNIKDYPEYDFYSVGNLHINPLSSEQTHLYKLDTNIRIVAVTKDSQLTTNPESLEEEDYIASSEVIDVSSGQNEYKINTLDLDNKTINISLQSNIPDVNYTIPTFYYFALFIIIIVLIISIIFINKKRKK